MQELTDDKVVQTILHHGPITLEEFGRMSYPVRAAYLALMLSWAKQLHERAVIVSNEAAWHKEDARAVVEFLARNGYAVLGVELWIPEGNVPRVIGWSDYEIRFSGDWDRYVQSNAQSDI